MPNSNEHFKPPLRDRIIPWYFVGAFSVVFVVNMVFVYMATQTHTGLATEQAYEKGLAYNDTLAGADASDALGWHSNIEYRDQHLIVDLEDDAHHDISDAEVVAHFVRPTQDGFDFSMPMMATGDGRYNAEVILPLPGQWEVKLGVLWQQQQYQATQRIFVE